MVDRFINLWRTICVCCKKKESEMKSKEFLTKFKEKLDKAQNDPNSKRSVYKSKDYSDNRRND